MRISDWSSDVCSSDLDHPERHPLPQGQQAGGAGRRIADGDPELRVTTADRHRSPRTRTRPRAAGTTRRTHTGPAAGTDRRSRALATAPAAPLHHLAQTHLPERTPPPHTPHRARAATAATTGT